MKTGGGVHGAKRDAACTDNNRDRKGEEAYPCVQEIGCGYRREVALVTVLREIKHIRSVWERRDTIPNTSYRKEDEGSHNQYGR